MRATCSGPVNSGQAWPGQRPTAMGLTYRARDPHVARARMAHGVEHELDWTGGEWEAASR
jgi:hypothetical protein